jgi:glycosyltransferase involved in cell wall biosynthesis
MAEPISVIILALNEESIITRCIQSVTWAQEVLVVDSGSTDRTVELAQKAGARVVFQPWLGWSAQRNKSAQLAAHDWVFFIEADEICTPQIAASIGRVLSNSPNGQDGYSFVRRGEFCGILLPNTKNRMRQIHFVRLFNRKFSSYNVDNLIHEEVKVPGTMRVLPGTLLHWRMTTLNQHFGKLNSNASLEAEELRRKGVKPYAFHILVRPLMRFCWVYFVCGAFRCGVRGMVAAMVEATGEFFRFAKLWEAERVTHLPDPPNDMLSTSYTPHTTIGIPPGP